MEAAAPAGFATAGAARATWSADGGGRAELARLHIRRERQYGDGQWTAAAAVKRMGLARTIRDCGRRTRPKAAGAVKA